MKFLKLFVIAALTIPLFFNIGCSKKEKDAIDFGEFDGGTYSNSFFNLKVSIPETWYVMDDETRVAIMQQGAKIVSGENKNLSAIINAADMQSLNLMSASESAPGSPVSSNPSIMIVAEKISHAPGIKRGSDYHFQSKKLMNESELIVSFPKDIYEEIIDGVSFDVLELSINIGNTMIYQRQYATIIKKYALLFVLTYQDDSGLQSLENILNTMSLNEA